ncbi:MAG: hypothetical protein ACLP5H_26350 [Desulfomonilaceae bacterium]
MTDSSFWRLLFLAVTVPAILLSQFVMAKDRGCAALIKDLELKRGHLAEYLVTLDKFRDRGESELESVLKRNVDGFLDRIKRAEEVTDWAQRKSPVTPEGISPVKTDAGEYVTKTCAELRAMLVQILRKTKSLKRREHSTFSDLTPAEKTTLYESEREFRTVTTILKARCPQVAGAGSARDGKKRKRHP